MTDEELIEAAAEAMHLAYESESQRRGHETREDTRKPWADVPEWNKTIMRVAVGAALEVFRREQVAPVDIDGCAVCGFHCTHDALINAAYQQGLAAARREQGALDEATAAENAGVQRAEAPDADEEALWRAVREAYLRDGFGWVEVEIAIEALIAYRERRYREVVQWAQEAYQHRFDEVRLPKDIAEGLGAALRALSERSEG